MAAAGVLVIYGYLLRCEDVIFFFDNQSVCCALVKGCSRSWDMQLLSTCWQLLCLQLGCRVWIEWVLSESNPADIYSPEKESQAYPQSTTRLTHSSCPLGQMSKQIKISKRCLTPSETMGCFFGATTFSLTSTSEPWITATLEARAVQGAFLGLPWTDY